MRNDTHILRSTVCVVALAALGWGAASCASVIGLDDLHRSSGDDGDAGLSPGTGSLGSAGAGGLGGTPGGTGVSPGGSNPGTGQVADAAAATDGAQPGPPPPQTGDASSAAPCGGTGGPPGVRVQFGGGSFCIDATEVTNDQYSQFLGANPSPSSRSCQNHTSFQPSQGWPYAASDARLPVVWVDWCDADAYCAWAGKSLCGAGNNNGLDPTADPTLGEWYAACSGPSNNAYPYGASYVSGTCNDTAPNGRPAAVESHAACVGGVSGLFDMSGNVSEWEDACTGWRDTDSCSVRGGAFDSTTSSGGLACNGRNLVTRSNGAANIGIRCCSS